jgi:hypothetical protein
MITQKIIEEIAAMYINENNIDDVLDRVDELMELLPDNKDAHLACEAMIQLLERHPYVVFGNPGEVVHTIEKYQGYYEEHLIASLDRKPVSITLWMLNRIINVKKGSEKDLLVQKMQAYSKHPLADDEAVDAALDFYNFQVNE